jgi:small-conductance mechanosensitive channel
VSDNTQNDPIEKVLRKLEDFGEPQRKSNAEWREKMHRLNAERQRAAAEADRALKRLQENLDGAPREITVNKRTHRIRLEGETEDEVTIIIEKKDGGR